MGTEYEKQAREAASQAKEKNYNSELRDLKNYRKAVQEASRQSVRDSYGIKDSKK